VIPTEDIVKMLESFDRHDLIFLFLGSLISRSNNPQVHFKYIEAAVKLNNTREICRLVLESNVYDPIQVKELLKNSKDIDPKPLIFLCDKHGFIEQLVKHFYEQKMNHYIEIYIFNINNKAAPTVLGTLIDLGCHETYIQEILTKVKNCSIDEIIQSFESRDKLLLLQNFLEAKSTTGDQSAVVHNALAKIYIDTNKNPQEYLEKNEFYESKVIEKYCQEKHPELSSIAFRKGKSTIGS